MNKAPGFRPENGARHAEDSAKVVKTQPAAGAIPPSLPHRYKRILVPVDFSECSINALNYAASFAEQYRATLLPFHVIEPGFSGSIDGFGGGMDGTHQRLLEGAREHLEELCHRQIGERVQSEMLVRIGRAPSEIADTAKAMGADLIIMGTHGTRGHKPSVMGSTAERVVRQASCPVLTVRFPGAPGASNPKG